MKDIKKILDEILDAGYEDSLDYLEDGYMDSLQVMELVDAIEENYGIELSGKDIVPENFVNQEMIVKLLRKYGVEE